MEGIEMADIAGSNGERREFNAVGKANVPGKLSHSTKQQG
jgi:hypothetical protein